jgi:predicted small lipoprotein YifL
VIARLTCVLLLVSLVACGKKGPPLAPLHLVPNVVNNVDARRSGDTVRIRFAVPTSNLNGPGPVQIDRVEIYAVTLAPGAQTLPNRDLLTATYRVGTISVKPAPVDGEPAPQNAAADTRPLPGDVTEFTEKLTPQTLQPITRPEPPAPPPSAAPVVATPAVPVPAYASRVYVIRGLTKGGRAGQPSARVQLALVALPAPPADVTGRFTETAVGLSWTAPPAPAEGAAPGFNVYAAGGAASLNVSPLAEPAFEQAGAEFGKEQCFVVRSVSVVGGVPIESEPSREDCVTPKDIFPPAAPQRLQAVPAPGVINLSWQPNAETDLAGYIVLRGAAPGDTLQALTPEPITATRFEDKTARAGSRYVYVVVAVDQATPRNTSAFSNRVEETAR